ETAATPGTSFGSTCSVCRSSNKPGVFQGRRVSRRTTPTAAPAAAATATHHQRPPNQPGCESPYHLPPTLITPPNISAANAPNTPRATAQPIKTQNSRCRVTGSAAACPGAAVTTHTPPELDLGPSAGRPHPASLSDKAHSRLTSSLATGWDQPATHLSL